jgi:hypothetical protein
MYKLVLLFAFVAVCSAQNSVFQVRVYNDQSQFDGPVCSVDLTQQPFGQGNNYIAIGAVDPVTQQWEPLPQNVAQVNTGEFARNTLV